MTVDSISLSEAVMVLEMTSVIYADKHKAKMSLQDHGVLVETERRTILVPFSNIKAIGMRPDVPALKKAK